jgi:hypothetical protein
MDDPDTEAWTARMSGRERVRAVVRTLETPQSVASIADRADVAWATADDELAHLCDQNRVEEHTDDGTTTYGVNPVQQFLDQVLDLIEEHSRDALETQLVEYQSRLETLQDEYDAESADDLRERLTDDDRTAAEMEAIRDAVATWDALETELRLYRRALDLYADIARLSGDDRNSVPV